MSCINPKAWQPIAVIYHCKSLGLGFYHPPEPLVELGRSPFYVISRGYALSTP
ncbi:hypothetical protein [Laspinema olomoucense]|uniref:hypothetical protein n=1 Tax=Laspinema olomoucense TaxID=3231600 RepID=UPI0021BB1FA6|nr:hypothetical protein [Laspinema sp. D3c]MCT7996652.1 hypothetical protein [Laspinema sp. D3c]